MSELGWEDRPYLNDRLKGAANRPAKLPPGVPARRPLLDRGRPFAHCCDNCAHEGYGRRHRCQGNPTDGTCHCRACWRQWLMSQWLEAREGNDTARLRILGDGLWSCHWQTDKAAMEHWQPGAQLHRRLRDQEAKAAQPVQEAPEPAGADTRRARESPPSARSAASGTGPGPPDDRPPWLVAREQAYGGAAADGAARLDD